jgi:hypothetical protein
MARVRHDIVYELSVARHYQSGWLGKLAQSGQRKNGQVL